MIIDVDKLRKDMLDECYGAFFVAVRPRETWDGVHGALLREVETCPSRRKEHGEGF